VLKSGVTRPPIEIGEDLIKLVHDRIGPVEIAITFSPLPKTVLRRNLERQSEEIR